MVEQGAKEIVVTGVCVGAYLDETCGARLPELMAAVAQVDGIRRVRLSSLQPIETDDALIDVLAAHPTICPHLHLSLQSGDDYVLRRMQRPYDTAYYRDLVRVACVAASQILRSRPTSSSDFLAKQARCSRTRCGSPGDRLFTDACFQIFAA